MRVPTRSASETAISQLQKLGSRQAELQRQVSTNQRVFLPSDDPAAVGRLLGIGDEQTRLAQFGRNLDLATNLAQASYSGLKSLNDLASRAGELATLGSGPLGAEANAAYATEVNQLLEQAVQVGNTRLGGDYLFAGTALDTAPFTATRDADGRIASVAYAGDQGTGAIPLSETASLAPRTSGETNLGIRDLINQLVSLRDALAANDPTAITAAGTSLEDAVDPVVGAISENGAAQLRIEVVKTQQSSRGDELERLASSEADADLADTMVRLSQTTTAYEAAMASAAKIMNLSLLDYIR